MIQPVLINLNPNKYSHDFHYYLSEVKLDRCVGSCDILNDLSIKVWVTDKTGYLNLSVLNMITGKNESKILTKDISCEGKCKFDGRKCNSNQKWNNDKCWYECKKYHLCERDYIWNLITCSCKNGKYLDSITDNSVITCDKIIDADVEAKSYDKETKTIPKNIICKTKSFYILLAFLLITIASLIVFSIYFCLIKYKAKQKHLLPYYVADDKLINVL